MQSGRNTKEAVKESAGNTAASARAGMDKTKATVQEKVDKMRTHDPVEKEMAGERKDERILEAELNKQEASEENAAARQAASATAGHGVTHGAGLGGTHR